MLVTVASGGEYNLFGKVRASGYLHVGLTTAPANITNGDLTAIRIFCSGNAALGSTAVLSNVRVLIGGSVTNDAAYAFGMYMGGVTLVLTANSRTGIGLYAGGIIETGSDSLTGLVAYAGYLEAQSKTGNGTIAVAVGLRITKPTIGTSNFYLEFPTADATPVVTLSGRLPIFVNGVLNYIPYGAV